MATQKKNNKSKKIEKKVIEAVVEIKEEEFKEKIETKPVKLCQCKIPRWKRIIQFLFPVKNEKENIIQYIFRQFYICDSSGQPSLTVSVLFYVMILVAIITFVEVQNAKVWITQTLDDKTVLSKPLGFSDHFLYLAVILSGVVTTYYRSRQNKIGSLEAGERSGLISVVIEKIKNKLK